MPFSRAFGRSVEPSNEEPQTFRDDQIFDATNLTVASWRDVPGKRFENPFRDSQHEHRSRLQTNAASRRTNTGRRSAALEDPKPASRVVGRPRWRSGVCEQYLRLRSAWRPPVEAQFKHPRSRSAESLTKKTTFPENPPCNHLEKGNALAW